MCTLPSHIATTVLVAICESKVHMIFSWLSKGVHIAPLEKKMTYMFTCTNFISSHFLPGSFRTQVILHNVVHFVLYSFLAHLDVDTERNILTKFKKSAQWSWRRCDNKKMFTDIRKNW